MPNLGSDRYQRCLQLGFRDNVRSWEDIVTEKRMLDEDYDSDEEDEDNPNLCADGNCMCKKSPQEFPDWKWFITRKGLKMVEHLKDEAMKRDQDACGQYHYNDYSGYGFQEVVENHVSF